MTSLSSLDDVDLTRYSSLVTQLKVKFDILTTHMRNAKLHRCSPFPFHVPLTSHHTSFHFARSLLAHILWYVREKTVLHKVLSIWVDRSELNLQSSDNENVEINNTNPRNSISAAESQKRTTFRKVAKVARQWIQRKSSISQSQGNNTTVRCATPLNFEEHQFY
jgi:hypothetical protein